MADASNACSRPSGWKRSIGVAIPNSDDCDRHYSDGDMQHQPASAQLQPPAVSPLLIASLRGFCTHALSVCICIRDLRPEPIQFSRPMQFGNTIPAAVPNATAGTYGVYGGGDYGGGDYGGGNYGPDQIEIPVARPVGVNKW